jgi:urea transporter
LFVIFSLQLPTFTFGFNFTTIVYFLAAFTFKYIPTDNSAIVPNAAFAGPPDFSGFNVSMDGWRFLQGSFIGVGQVFFCSHWVSSVVILIGMYIASHSLALVALVSSIGGAIVGMSVGANPKVHHAASILFTRNCISTVEFCTRKSSLVCGATTACWLVWLSTF